MHHTSIFRAAALVVAFAGTATLAVAEERGSRDEAKQMVDAAVEYVKKVGPEKAYKDFTDKSNAEWHKKDVYVFVYTMDGAGLAHGSNEKLVGKDLGDLKDQNGKAFVKEFGATAKKGSGWVEYDWAHPQTKKVESKVSYIRKIDGMEAYAGAGVYVK